MTGLRQQEIVARLRAGDLDRPLLDEAADVIVAQLDERDRLTKALHAALAPEPDSTDTEAWQEWHDRLSDARIVALEGHDQ